MSIEEFIKQGYTIHMKEESLTYSEVIIGSDNKVKDYEQIFHEIDENSNYRAYFIYDKDNRLVADFGIDGLDDGELPQEVLKYIESMEG